MGMNLSLLSGPDESFEDADLVVFEENLVMFGGGGYGVKLRVVSVTGSE